MTGGSTAALQSRIKAFAEQLATQTEELDKQAHEIEAETVAYVVCEHFGVPCTAPAYLGLYGADSKDILARFESIVGTIQKIIAGCESYLITQRPAANG